ncbi:MAG: hypothetical protein ACN6OJ_20365 [Chryseobacterium sp.]|uniref:hypothetical protein n=1 Tax=Chryseobacterium sp. TaxID=1871047 RepID=UPI003D0C5CCF
MEHLNKTMGLLMKNGSFVGCSVVFPLDGEFLCLTAGHNIYGKNFDQIFDINVWKVEDHLGIKHAIKECICDVNFAKEHDIVILRLKCGSDLQSFHCPEFYSIPINPAHSFTFRAKYEQSKTVVTQRHLQFNSLCTESDFKFFCTIEKALLMNNDYKSGSDWLGGWSGSGLFLDNHHQLICFGVMTDIPNKGNDGQLKFTSISALDKLNINFNIRAASHLDLEKKLLASSINAIFDQTDDEAISKWTEDKINKPQLEYINTKLAKAYNDNRLDLMRKNTIKKLIIGRTFLSTELKKHETIFNQYTKAYNAYALEDLEIVANNRKEANAGIKKIKETYEVYLLSCLEGILGIDDIKILANYGISDWIANCSLSFLENE